MKKIKTHVPMFLVGILICAVLSVVMFFVGVKPLMRYNNLIKNGKEVQAEIVDVRESNVSINEEATYNLKVEFKNEVGETIEGWTLDYFDFYDAEDLIDEGVITIRYIGTDIIYSTSLLSTTGTASLAFSAGCVITGLLALFLLGMAIKTILSAMSLNGLLESGASAKASFVEQGKAMTMGNTKYYSVVYKYTDNNGQAVTKTSPKNYTELEVTKLKAAGTFEIKVKDSKSIIAFNFDKE